MRGTKGNLGITKKVTKSRASGRMVAGSSLKQAGQKAGHAGSGRSSVTSTGKGGTHK